MRFWCSLTVTRQQSHRQCRPQPVSVKGADCQQVQVCRKDPALVQITPVKNRQRDAVTMSRYE
ncbi:hypothetical protein R1192_003304 [Salmonella enterica]|nr:hypothetical protein [Salmonella enterica]EHG4289555.1 hypothetical protein [Salmonella enterica subsp. houtenae serovar 48:g,z51:-]EGF0543747.1 hypothetical protein [Salmonella enterica]EHM5521198.1 hypothetical protein [Salmonella enterica]EIQ8700637.1 hypothetical protein [Salmonella enterica]